jgi:hypothetical protein
MGNFEKYNCRIKTKSTSQNLNPSWDIKTRKQITEKIELPIQDRTVFINNFCFTIETKRHRAEDVRLDGVNLLVKYNNKLSDATTQSENQKYSLMNFLKDRLSFSPYICNFIWFKNIIWESIKGLLGNNSNLYTKHNYLPNSFKFPFLIQLACIQNIPYTAIDINKNQYKGYSTFSCLKKNQSFDYTQMDSVFDIFKKVKQGTGQLTRKKIEQITSNILGEQQYAKAIGEKLIVISGRAGTGKTIKLLKIACDLAINN